MKKKKSKRLSRKPARMKPELFRELLGAATEILEHAQGKRTLRTTIVRRAASPR
jgi:hypothetical protein